MYQIKSSLGSALGLLIAVVAIVGTQVFGWEWGSGLLLPTMIGVGAAGIAILFLAGRVLD